MALFNGAYGMVAVGKLLLPSEHPPAAKALLVAFKAKAAASTDVADIEEVATAIDVTTAAAQPFCQQFDPSQARC